ncbi:MAG: hypothetical protein J6W16_02400 [Methanobrevibacter sp.]|nr:hypothetical protein [Methanobrevibacter sp.]
MAEAALINDPVVRAAKEALLQEEYQEKIIALTEQNERYKQDLNESTFAELNYMYSVNIDNYDLMTIEQQAALNSLETANQGAFDLIFGLYNENTAKFHEMAQDHKDVVETQMVPQ